MTAKLTPLLQPSDFDNAPEDDESAFLFLEELARNRLYNASEEDINGNPIFPLRNEYMTRVSSLAQVYNIPGIKIETYGDFDREFNRFLSCVDYQNTQLSAILSREKRKSVVTLTGPQKEKIRHHVAQIQNAIKNSNLSLKRKEAILQRLDDLAKEIERPSSSLKRVLIAAAIMLSVGADTSELSEPVGNAATAIIRIAGEARLDADEELLVRIPPPPRQIEGPRNVEPSISVQTLDEEIPF